MSAFVYIYPPLNNTGLSIPKFYHKDDSGSELRTPFQRRAELAVYLSQLPLSHCFLWDIPLLHGLQTAGASLPRSTAPSFPLSGALGGWGIDTTTESKMVMYPAPSCHCHQNTSGLPNSTKSPSSPSLALCGQLRTEWKLVFLKPMLCGLIGCSQFPSGP